MIFSRAYTNPGINFFINRDVSVIFYCFNDLGVKARLISNILGFIIGVCYNVKLWFIWSKKFFMNPFVLIYFSAVI